MTEIEAKVKYVKLARSLRTYGVSFFLVKVSYIDFCDHFNEVALHQWKDHPPHRVRNLAWSSFLLFAKFDYLKKGEADFGIGWNVFTEPFISWLWNLFFGCGVNWIKRLRALQYRSRWGNRLCPPGLSKLLMSHKPEQEGKCPQNMPGGHLLGPVKTKSVSAKITHW